MKLLLSMDACLEEDARLNINLMTGIKREW